MGGASSDGGDEVTTVSAAGRPWQVSGGLRRLGLASWLVLGVALVLGLVLLVGVAAAGIVIPFVVAALFGAVVFPLVDRLERWRLPRWVAALLMVVLAVLLILGMVLVVAGAVVQQWPEITASLEAGVAEFNQTLAGYDIDAPSTEEVAAAAKKFLPSAAAGVASTVAGLVSSLTQLGFGLFIALNILFWLAKDGRRIGRWAGRHIGLPGDVGVQVVKNSVRALQRYFVGVTLIALLNGVVVGVAAWALGVPLALTIGLVTFVFAYIPYFGAIVGGAFAVLIALGAGGSADAVTMLIVVILANGPIQNVAQQFVLGDALEMHPLAIILITTTGGIVGGALGAMFAAPFAKTLVDARSTISDAGVFRYPEDEQAAPGATAEDPAG